ncbi:MAG: hypothetical protein RJS97_05015 [Parvibaculaceae bacterium]
MQIAQQYRQTDFTSGSRTKNFVLRFTMAFLAMNLVFATPSHAIPVFDAANYAQNLLTALRTLQVVAQQATQLSNQVRQIENQAAMLRTIDINTAVDLAGQLNILTETYSRAGEIFYKADQITAQMRQMYPDADQLLNFPDIENNARAYRNRAKQLAQYSAEVHAAVLENSPQTQARVLRLINASNSAAGQTAATQAGNQLLGTLSGQLTELVSVLAAHHQTVENRISEDAARQARAEATSSRLSNYRTPRSTTQGNALSW